MLELYLFECQSYGGNSGSPVFFKLDRFRDVKEGRIKTDDEYYLAGVMKGYFTNFSEVRQMETRTDLYSSQNVGIAAVTPCYQLQEILFGEELTKMRKEYEKKMTAAQA